MHKNTRCAPQPNTLSQSDGTLYQALSYDAWGRRRNPTNWNNYTVSTATLITSHGYTGHEHLDEFNLINMNGRVYDPLIGRFLSPDNNLQATNTQSFNKYSYCLNNPLKYTDPSGWCVEGANSSNEYGDGAGGWSRGVYSFVTANMDYAPTLSQSYAAVQTFLFIQAIMQANKQSVLAVINSYTNCLSYFDEVSAGYNFLTGQSYGVGYNYVVKQIAGKSFSIADIFGACSIAHCANNTSNKIGQLRFYQNYFGVNYYISKDLGNAVSIPNLGVIIGQSAFNGWSKLNQLTNLMQHEFGHLLQYKYFGSGYYTEVASLSLLSASTGNALLHASMPWEKEANLLASWFFGSASVMGAKGSYWETGYWKGSLLLQGVMSTSELMNNTVNYWENVFYNTERNINYYSDPKNWGLY